MPRAKGQKKVDFTAISDILVPYRRVSTGQQFDSGYGLDAQKTKLTGYFTYSGRQALNWDCVDVKSGKNADRPGLDRAISLVRAGKAGGIVVSKLDRLSRSIQDFAHLIDTARKEGWNIVLLDLQIDLTTPQGELMAVIVAAIAQFERRIIGERTRDALAELKDQGTRLGRPREMDSSMLGMIVDLYARTGSYRGVAKLLNDDEVPTTSGGQMWYPSVVHATVNSADGQALLAELAKEAA